MRGLYKCTNSLLSLADPHAPHTKHGARPHTHGDGPDRDGDGKVIRSGRRRWRPQVLVGAVEAPSAEPRRGLAHPMVRAIERRRDVASASFSQRNLSCQASDADRLRFAHSEHPSCALFTRLNALAAPEAKASAERL